MTRRIIKPAAVTKPEGLSWEEVADALMVANVSLSVEIKRLERENNELALKLFAAKAGVSVQDVMDGLTDDSSDSGTDDDDTEVSEGDYVDDDSDIEPDTEIDDGDGDGSDGEEEAEESVEQPEPVTAVATKPPRKTRGKRAATTQ